ncbi:hypothetical protein CPJ18_11110 [Agrobacterium rosae]|uniref:Uncharacterized protein n=2 Tax=Agrobacterium rosae TaxID=1972867 RepID=A0AAE5VP03_9HYPH|nr:hypothetical protein DXM21_04300 [Agrobacterium rosae]KAA3522733.1 hypothetical protein DXM25_04305 [Agrobacterium rosae]MQB47396.1 hypothetical protein [Agrobacterium rosae]POO51115.1 hypothetical protein CPJ18_11110 [Agrobacterium rosae]
MRFYRGLTVDSAAAIGVMQDIRMEGLASNTSKGRFLRWRPDPGLLNKDDLTLNDTRGERFRFDPVLACGTLEGALHYACKFNSQSDTRNPIIVEFDAEKSDVLIDGVDYAYDLFQANQDFKGLPAAVADIYGEKGLLYARRAWASQDPKCKIALADLMVADPEVVEFHYCNRNLIKASDKLMFHNAFALMRPIPASAIMNVYSPCGPYRPGKPHVVLNDVLGR